MAALTRAAASYTTNGDTTPCSLRNWAAERRVDAFEHLPKAWRRFKHTALPGVSIS